MIMRLRRLRNPEKRRIGMEHITFSPRGVCSMKIDNVKYVGGCNGNIKAIGRLVEGKNAAEVADILRGNDCNGRGTFCANQFAKAIDQALGQ